MTEGRAAILPGAQRSYRLLLRVAGVVVLCAVLATAFQAVTAVHSQDLAVYRAAGRAAIDATSLYGAGFNAELPFTYPPFAAITSVPLAALPWGATQWVWTFVSLLLLSVCVHLSYRQLPLRSWRYPALLGVIVLWTLTQPVADHLGYGQVGMLLMALCLVDLLARPRWLPSGVLIGASAAIKLVPALFLGFFALIRDWRTVMVGVGSFAAFTVGAAALLPKDSWAYFTDVIFSLSDRVAVGDPTVFGNQSLRGALLRLLPDEPAMSVWLGLSLLVVAGGAVAAWRANRLRGPLAGFVVVALCATIITPVAWPHHFVWIIPAVAALLASTSEDRWQVPPLCLAAALAVVVVPLARLPRIGSEFDVPVLSELLENSLLLASIAVVAALAAPIAARPKEAAPLS
jgi:alpha-1,2-mannosyltransferase